MRRAVHPITGTSARCACRSHAGSRLTGGAHRLDSIIAKRYAPLFCLRRLSLAGSTWTGTSSYAQCDSRPTNSNSLFGHGTSRNVCGHVACDREARAGTRLRRGSVCRDSEGNAQAPKCGALNSIHKWLNVHALSSITFSSETADERIAETPDSYFDVVICNDVLEHLVDPSTTLDASSAQAQVRGRRRCVHPEHSPTRRR